MTESTGFFTPPEPEPAAAAEPPAPEPTGTETVEESGTEPAPPGQVYQDGAPADVPPAEPAAPAAEAEPSAPAEPAPDTGAPAPAEPAETLSEPPAAELPDPAAGLLADLPDSPGVLRELFDNITRRLRNLEKQSHAHEG